MKKYTHTYNRDFCCLANDIARDIVEYLNNDEYNDLDQAITEEVERFLIYYDDQWELLKAYCTPDSCDLGYAIECLFNDLYNLIKEV